MTDPTRDYLLRVIDWTDPNGGSAFVNIHYTKQEEQDNKTSPWWGYSSNKIDQALQHVRHLNKKQVNVFLRQSSCSEAQQSNGTGGFSRAARRLQQNTHRLRTFFFDLDVKPGAYADTATAWTDLYRVCAAAGLPHPQVIVLSGSGGLHVYWVLDHGITAAVWKPLAQAMIRCLEHHGLLFDKQCSSDSARVLRVPGTNNWKGGDAKPVQLATGAAWIAEDYTLAQMQALLEPWMQVAAGSNVHALPGVDLSLAIKAATQGIPNPLGQPGPPRAPLPDTGEFSQGVDRNVPVDLGRVVAYCPIFQEAAATGGRDHDNGMWHQLVYNTSFGENGRAYAHAVSSGHRSYTPAEVDAEFDRAVATRAADPSKGWTACTTFGSLAPAKCSSCALAGQIGYPLMIGAGQSGAHKVSQILGAAMVRPANVVAIQPTASPPPNALAASGPPPIRWPYYRNELGIWRESKPAKDGTPEPPVLVLPYDVLEARLERHPQHGTCLIAKLKLPHGRTGDLFVIGAKKQPADIDAAFGRADCDLHDHQVKLARAFVVDFMRQLQEATYHLNVTPALGWVMDGAAYKGFAYDGRVHGAGIAAGAGDTNVVVHYKPTGDYQAWKDAANAVLSQGRQDLNAIVAAAFAAPLIELGSQAGTLLSAYSTQSGIGKSTAMKVAQAVWADPAAAMSTMDDTTNSAMGRTGVLRHLPLLWDELKGNDNINKFVSMFYQLCQGKEKSRMSASATARETNTWRTMMVVASNNSILDFMTTADRNTDAGLMRTFEITVKPSRAPKPTPEQQVQFENLIRGANKSYGHAGLQYATWLGQNHAQAKQAYDTIYAMVLDRVKATPEERFWVVTVTTLICGAFFATKLGICRFDVTALTDFLCDNFQVLRRGRTIDTASIDTPAPLVALLGRYHGAMISRHTLITDYLFAERDALGKKLPLKVSVLSDVTRIERVVVQAALLDGVLRLDRGEFRQWMVDNRVPPRAVFDGLAELFGATTKNGVMAPGTPHAYGRIMVIDIDLHKLRQAGLLSFAGWDEWIEQKRGQSAIQPAPVGPAGLTQAMQAATAGITS